MQKYQGDVGAIAIKEAPKIDFGPLPENGLIIAEGEVTGHKHVLVADREAVVEFGRDERGVYVVNVKDGQAKLVHGKHDIQVLERGIWAMPVQYEYDDEEDRRTLD